MRYPISNGDVADHKSECMNRSKRLDIVSGGGFWTASQPLIEPIQKLWPSTNPDAGSPDESNAKRGEKQIEIVNKFKKKSVV